jgi:septal ring factor EnvC (AmiA/AmiB activator)
LRSEPEIQVARERGPGLAGRAVFVLACGLALAIPIARADGATIGALEGKIADAEEEAQDLNAEVADSVVSLAEARKDASLAAGREDELAATLAEGRARSATLAQDLARAQRDLEVAEQRLERAQSALAERLVAIYKSGEVSELDVLLDSSGYEDLTTRAELLGRIQAADLALAERVQSLRGQISERVAEVEGAKERSDALNAELEAARSAISAARAEAEARAAAVAEARAAQEATLRELDGQMASWSDRVERLERIPEEEAVEVVEEEAAEPGAFGQWAIPEAIVMCESGGNFSALNPSSGAGGAYQIIPSTWRLYGGEGLPHEASPAEQHRIAAMIWADSGPSAWVCAG